MMDESSDKEVKLTNHPRIPRDQISRSTTGHEGSTKRRFTSYSAFYNRDHVNNFHNKYRTVQVASWGDASVGTSHIQYHEQDKKDSGSAHNEKVPKPLQMSTATKSSNSQPRKRVIPTIAGSHYSINNHSTIASTINPEHNQGNLKYNKTQTARSKGDLRWSLNARCLVIPIAVLMWYILGVLSISTTKILLTKYDKIGMNPLVLTLQQLSIGMAVLRLWIMVSKGNTSFPITLKQMVLIAFNKGEEDRSGYLELFLSSVFFAFGFLMTNLSFSAADASFVETIKASEPISSAGLSVLWKLETLSFKESYSLLGICVGVVISTVGNVNSVGVTEAGASASLIQSFRSSAIVMGSNLCFSFRSLYQKLFRASPIGRPSLVDDFQMQYYVHQIGVFGMLFMSLLFESASFVRVLLNPFSVGLETRGDVYQFILLSILNGLAFTHYNLASSYILSRISVVTHAALNCIRRLFAIIVTSIIFAVPITRVSSLGISVSISSFLFYTRFKAQSKSKHHHAATSILPP